MGYHKPSQRLDVLVFSKLGAIAPCGGQVVGAEGILGHNADPGEIGRMEEQEWAIRTCYKNLSPKTYALDHIAYRFTHYTLAE